MIRMYRFRFLPFFTRTRHPTNWDRATMLILLLSNVPIAHIFFKLCHVLFSFEAFLRFLTLAIAMRAIHYQQPIHMAQLTS